MPVDAPSVMSEDGSRVFFMTPEALVARDVNEALDVYEWKDGRQALLTDGLVAHSALTGNRLRGVSADGRDVLIRSFAAFTPDAPNATQQTYNVRIGGGFLRESPPLPCGGEGCKGPEIDAPPASGPSTESFSGPGNEKAKRCPRAKRATVRKGKARCVSKRSGKGARKGRADSNRGGRR